MEAARDLMLGHTHELDIGKVNDRVFTNFFGIGLITDTSENINSELKGTLGRLSYFISTLQTVRTTEPFRYGVELDGHTRTGDAVMIYISNGRSLGTQTLPFSRESLHDGLLDVLIIKEAGIPLLKELLGRKVQGEWKPDNDRIEYVQAASVRLTTDHPMRADTDGEVYIEVPAAITIMPRALRFLTGFK
ncbi:iron(III) dicitrate ABC transporter [Paenibacillus sp. JCM 10914]|nr:iron(III) dicitrate ABC transporter [Paenibacillus sp. JCM 10914]